MRKLLFAAVMALALPLMIDAAQAQPRPAGGDCEDMAHTYGPQKLWWGRFSGGRRARNLWLNDRGVEYHTTEACFTSRQSCEAWLYRLKSDWQFMPRWNECLRGYRG